MKHYLTYIFALFILLIYILSTESNNQMNLLSFDELSSFYGGTAGHADYQCAPNGNGFWCFEYLPCQVLRDRVDCVDPQHLDISVLICHHIQCIVFA